MKIGTTRNGKTYNEEFESSWVQVVGRLMATAVRF
jgi:hypothetical protein